MKATLTFSLPEEREEFDNAVNGGKNAEIITDIYTQVFRPAFKHGYDNLELRALLEGDHGDAVYRAIELLHNLYIQAIHDND